MGGAEALFARDIKAGSLGGQIPIGDDLRALLPGVVIDLHLTLSEVLSITTEILLEQGFRRGTNTRTFFWGPEAPSRDYLD